MNKKSGTLPEEYIIVTKICKLIIDTETVHSDNEKISLTNCINESVFLIVSFSCKIKL